MDSSISAINHKGSLSTTSSVYCKRQNSADGALGGHPALTAGGPHCSTTVPRGTTAPGLRPPGASPKRNGTSLDGIRCGNIALRGFPIPSSPAQITTCVYVFVGEGCFCKWDHGEIRNFHKYLYGFYCSQRHLTSTFDCK